MTVIEKADIESRLRMSRLLALYGELLPSQQKLAASLHYDEDLSMSEIAESKGTTRQAVYDAIRMARKSLENYDRVLGLLGKNNGVSSSSETRTGSGDWNSIKAILDDIRRRYLRGTILYDTKGLRARIDELEALLSPDGVVTREDESDV